MLTLGAYSLGLPTIRKLLPMRDYSRRAFLALVPGAALAACNTQTTGSAGAQVTMARRPSPAILAHYGTVEDGGFTVPAVQPGYLTGLRARIEVYYTGPDKPGSIVVDPYARLLYHIGENGRAMRYGIAVGRAGYGFRGDAIVGAKAEWPSWTPTKNMLRREPEVYGPVAGGLPGGLENPLGARALYLYRGGRDTMYRIHGTNNASTIGRATSAGCVRLFNQDIIDLYDRVRPGAFVHVRSRAESMVAEDPMVENAAGLMVPVATFPPDVQDQIRAGNIPWPRFQPMRGIGAETAPPDVAGAV